MAGGTRTRSGIDENCMKVSFIFKLYLFPAMFRKTYADKQFEQFDRFTQLLEFEGIHIPLKHCANSAGIMEMRKTHLDVVRSGKARRAKLFFLRQRVGKRSKLKEIVK